ncbi:MAG TPA: c-type cytochrome [Gemmatimonadales bacterium]|nr:c-type cytochrome [Gemmatimonadales bacterium]
MRRALFALGWVLPAAAAAQIPEKFENLKFLPPGITRDSLLTVMRGFSFALGVRCQYCHVGGDGVSFEGVEFHKDDDPDKRKARAMLDMVRHLNDEVLANLPDRDDPPLRVECKTCHRGLARPVLLKQELRLVLDRAGADSAVARYRDLRNRATLAGVFDFGEWETNTLAEDLSREGRRQDAIVIYRLNEEFYPESASIKGSLAQLYEAVGDTVQAINYYEKVLVLAPTFAPARRRLEALRPRGP